MPGIIIPPSSTTITKFSNCRLVRGDKLVNEDLWVSSFTGTILSSQAAFFDGRKLPDQVVDLGGRIVSPGLLDVQLNGAFGFNFSTLLEDDSVYGELVDGVNKKLVRTGVTSYMPTVTSQEPALYQKVLPFLRPKAGREPSSGAESLGAHVEGPFLSKTKNGCHNQDMVLEASSLQDLVSCYGVENLGGDASGQSPYEQGPAIRKITVAPEQGRMMDLIPDLTTRNIIVSIGHTEATYEEASAAVASGATMVTHLFNAMKSLHHRNPGVFGLLGTASPNFVKPYFGMIADNIHVHPTAVKLAYNAHPEGFILVTDAMHLTGLPDGPYPWTNGDVASTIVKKGSVLCLEGTDKIAGSSITLVECVNNFLSWFGGEGVAKALKAVTATSARMLGIENKKGHLTEGADADLVIFSEEIEENGTTKLVVDEVWKRARPSWPSIAHVIINAAGSTSREWAEAPTLFFKLSDATEASVRSQIEKVKEFASQSGSKGFEFAKNVEEQHELWSARKEALWSTIAMKEDPTDQVWTGDVAVPVSRMPTLIQVTKDAMAKAGLFGTIVGHAGDGNFHVFLLYKQSQRTTAEHVIHDMVEKAIQMEGTVTGEHGVGIVKRDYLATELGQSTVDAMRLIKKALDPLCILNCDKVVRMSAVDSS